jgi:hypothetical protein
MIDCSIVIEPDAAMRSAIERLLASPHIDSINHTLHRPLVELPIAVNLELKRTNDNWEQAQVQCAVWVTAQYTWLKKLVKDLREARILQRQELLLQQRPSQSPQLPQRMEGMTIRPTSAPASATAADESASTPASTAAATASDTTASGDNTSSATGASTLADRDGASNATMIPFLPLVIVQGHHWHFLAASLSETGTVSSFLSTCYFPTHRHVSNLIFSSAIFPCALSLSPDTLCTDPWFPFPSGARKVRLINRECLRV